VHYGADLNGGRLEPRRVDPELFVYPRSLDKMYLLERVASGAEVTDLLEGLAPHDQGYRALKQALAHYRALAAAGGWPAVDPGDTLDPGMRDRRVLQLRKRLCVTGELSDCGEDGDRSLFDPALQAAVERFQASHGLETDGRVGKATLAHLNTPVEARIQQILANLERERWVTGINGERYLVVNLADFTLHLFEGGSEVLTSKVVIGTPYNRTPVFRRNMTYLEINPYWNVPPSIAGKELLPKIKKDPGYLPKNHYEVLASWSEDAAVLDPQSIDWGKFSARSLPYKIRQTPGDWNALGRIKFMLPNEFNIYLHDTPAKSLFAKSQRSFSHGCIRVEKPLDLAVEVLKNQEGWDREAILAAIATGQRQIVSLQQPIPVKIDYRTAWVDAGGGLQFRGDIYGRDKLLIGALLGPRSSAESLPAQ
jgi:murein L,D-transpeptidase YcbB/YkuD